MIGISPLRVAFKAEKIGLSGKSVGSQRSPPAHRRNADTYSPLGVTKSPGWEQRCGGGWKYHSNRVVGSFGAIVDTDRSISRCRLCRTDPLYMASICADMTSSSDARTDPAQTRIIMATAVPFVRGAMAAQLPSIRPRWFL